ncbi:MAG: carbohydrate porin [Syntrophobacteraceae bacterium]|nr:carbohydrate porin [Syntrophobacteraceae bacterium]
MHAIIKSFHIANRFSKRFVIFLSKRVICSALMFLFIYVIFGPTLAGAAGDQACPAWTDMAQAGAGQDLGGAPTVDAEPPAGTAADTSTLHEWVPRVLGAQADYLLQGALPFHNPYQGPNSFSDVGGDREDLTQVYGVYLGSQLAPGLQLYIDSEMFKGDGLSKGVGLSGYVNGDALRAGSNGLPNDPYIARFYFRYFQALSAETSKVDAGPDQLPGYEPVSRWEMKIGKMAAVDDFDLNRYANNNRTQFMNFDFLYNTSWDYAADTRGYSYGIVEALYQPSWKTVLGIYLQPNEANGANFNFDNMRALGYNWEFDIKPNSSGTVVRFLTFFNTGKMGDYDEALAIAQATGTVPNIVGVEKLGGYKYGFGLNFEQPLADDGETGLFGRLGWDNGTHEAWSYTECDRDVSLGAQVSGVHWGREQDRAGGAYGVDGLSKAHRDYLEAGGIGTLLGDGKLNYGFEQVLEVYYMVQVNRFVQVSPDFQFILNPGYNCDRGPVEVFGLRVRLSYTPL